MVRCSSSTVKHFIGISDETWGLLILGWIVRTDLLTRVGEKNEGDALESN